MASGIRFDPPRVEVSPELGWVLRRAFGPPQWKVEGGLHSEAALELAARLDLGPRIASRTDHQVLQAEVGTEAAARLRAAFGEAAARTLVVERVCREVVEACAEIDAAPIFLKGAAMQLAGYTAAGARSMSDVDVLVPKASAESVQRRLVERMGTEVPGPTGEHQLRVIGNRLGIDVEVHLMVLGVRPDGSSGSAGADDLRSQEVLRTVEGFPGTCFLPAPDILLAHLLAHGIAQHGLMPVSYPMFRLLADAQDLLPDRAAWDRELAGAMRWIAGDVSAEEAAAVRDLVLRLAAGEDPAAVATGRDNPGRLLRHVIAGVLEADYDRALRLRSRLTPLAAGGSPRTFLVRAFQTVWLTREQVEALYGQPRSALGYWGWRLWRPLDLVGRAWRYGAAWLRHRGRER